MNRPAFLYLLEPPRTSFVHDITQDEAAVMQDHHTYLKELMAGGSLVLAGPSTDEPSVVIAIFEAEDQLSAEAIVARDPAVKCGLMKPTLHPFRISLIRHLSSRAAADLTRG